MRGYIKMGFMDNLKEAWNAPPPKRKYSVEIICTNCGEHSSIKEEVGKVVSNKRLESKECPCCECKKVFRRNFLSKDDDSSDSSVAVMGAAAVCAAAACSGGGS